MPTQKTVNRYLLSREIGRGGMGVIWEAIDPQLRRPVAIKVLASDRSTSEEIRRNFEHEARAVAQLRNPHVVDIYDYGVDDGAPYIVMELLQGEDLDARLRRCRRLPLPSVLAVLRQVANGLEAAHASGIIHRDLKPGNLFITHADVGEVIKILDFGVAQMMAELHAEPAARGTQLVGTPPYMSPEQVRGASVDHRSDLWALAVVAYQMLTGWLPFNEGSLGGLIVSISTDSFPPPSSLVSELPPAVDGFFERALAKDPSRRFQTPRELASAFAVLCDERSDAPVRILVVDDEPDMHELIRQRFRRRRKDPPYEFIYASDGERALEQLREHPDVQVILSDIRMPVMDGLTLLERLEGLNGAPLPIMVSAFGDMENIRKAMNLGAFDFVLKPIDLRDLELTLEKAIRRVVEIRKSEQSNEENKLLRLFVNPMLIERLSAVGPSGAGACEAFDATVVFVDIWQFAESADALPPEETVRRLNANFEAIVPEMISRGGVVDRFFLDRMMVVFHGEDHVSRALDACVAVRAQLVALELRAGAGSPYEHGARVGLATGRVVVGSIGSRAYGRLDYTAMGRVVATAARLAKAAARGQILVDEMVRRSAGAGIQLEPTQISYLDARGRPSPAYQLLDGVRRTASMDELTIRVVRN